MSNQNQTVLKDLQLEPSIEGADKLGGLSGISSHLDQLKAEQDRNRPLTRWEKKKKRILGESTVMKRNFGMGFLMGGAVGGLMGGLTGTYFAF